MEDKVKMLMEQVKAKLDTMPTSEQFTSFGNAVKKNSELIAENSKRMDEHYEKFWKISDALERIEREQIDARRGLESRVKAVVESNAYDPTSDGYNVARRPIRLWPIEGKDEKELVDNAQAFLRDTLEMKKERTGKIRKRSRGWITRKGVSSIMKSL